jgi:hypothetical protein
VCPGTSGEQTILGVPTPKVRKSAPTSCVSHPGFTTEANHWANGPPRPPRTPQAQGGPDPKNHAPKVSPRHPKDSKELPQGPCTAELPLNSKRASCAEPPGLGFPTQKLRRHPREIQRVAQGLPRKRPRGPKGPPQGPRV